MVTGRSALALSSHGCKQRIATDEAATASTTNLAVFFSPIVIFLTYGGVPGRVRCTVGLSQAKRTQRPPGAPGTTKPSTQYSQQLSFRT